MEEYFQRIKTNAEHLAKNVFPKKALELDELINVILLVRYGKKINLFSFVLKSLE